MTHCEGHDREPFFRGKKGKVTRKRTGGALQGKATPPHSSSCGVGWSFCERGLHLHILGISVPLDGKLQDIGKSTSTMVSVKEINATRKGVVLQSVREELTIHDRDEDKAATCRHDPYQKGKGYVVQCRWGWEGGLFMSG